MTINKHVIHWMKADHLAFLLILPAIFIDKWLAIFLWSITLIYDLYEQYIKQEN